MTCITWGSDRMAQWAFRLLRFMCLCYQSQDAFSRLCALPRHPSRRQHVVRCVAEQLHWLISLLPLPVWAHPLLRALALFQPIPRLFRLTKPAGNYLVLIVFYSGCISHFMGSCGWICSQRGLTSSRLVSDDQQENKSEREYGPASFWPLRAIGLVNPAVSRFTPGHFLTAPTLRWKTGLEGSGCLNSTPWCWICSSAVTCQSFVVCISAVAACFNICRFSLLRLL